SNIRLFAGTLIFVGLAALIGGYFFEAWRIPLIAGGALLLLFGFLKSWLVDRVKNRVYWNETGLWQISSNPKGNTWESLWNDLLTVYYDEKTSSFTLATQHGDIQFPRPTHNMQYYFYAVIGYHLTDDEVTEIA